VVAEEKEETERTKGKLKISKGAQNVVSRILGVTTVWLRRRSCCQWRWRRVVRVKAERRMKEWRGEERRGEGR
jgi:hypothetical protein